MFLPFSKMKSETADFAHGAATWRTRRNIPYIRVVFDSSLFPPLYENMTSCQRSRVTCTENYVKFGRVVFEIRRASRQTNKQAKIQTRCTITILRTPAGDKVINHHRISSVDELSNIRCLSARRNRTKLISLAPLPFYDLSIIAN